MSISSNAPLAGFTVVEHAQGVAGSYAGRMMAVMGATVIKVEPPGEGSALRRAEPLLTQHPPASALFHYLNSGKQFVTCDSGSAEGRERLDELIARADLLIDDTPVARRAACGLDPQNVAARYPGLVYLSVLPFGAWGAHADYRAYELNVLHAGGEGYLMPNGLTLETFPDRPPVKIYGHFAELIGGTSAVCAGVSALLAREKSGGQFVDVSVQDANVSVGCFAIQRLGDGVLENRHGRSFKYGGVLECSDGYVGVLTLEQRQWEGLVKLMGEPAWALDPVWRDPLERSRRGAEINRHLRAWAKTQRVEDVVKNGQALSVPLAKYNLPSDILASAQSRARGIFAPLELPALGAVPAFTAPFQLNGEALALGRAAVAPGADNQAVFGGKPPHNTVELHSGRRATPKTALPPLHGVRVADFTLHAAGPFCAHLLSLLGAECIKIETAGRLDIFRKPHPVYGRMDAATFDQVASNKLSVQLDLKQPRGRELAKRLVAMSDIVAESFRPGVMDRLGLNYAALKAVKHDIVMVSVSASGQTGPERGYAGYAPLFGAAGGLGTLTGYEDGPPTEIRHVMDHSTGLTAAMATLAAYLRKTRTGEGQHVDVAAREVACGFIGDALLQFAATGVAPHRAGNDAPHIAPHNVYPCKDADSLVSIVVATDDEWRAFAAALERPQWLAAGRYESAQSRCTHRRELDAEISQWTRARSREEVTRILQAAGVAAFASYTGQDIADDAHLNARGAIKSMRGPEGETRKVVGPPWRFGRTPTQYERWTPKLGEHNQYVFGELLGLSAGEIEELVVSKVIY
jgi:crotonobetainyl-CoA:carnitine CoA-transferase CaiB-like acyl-CoA transferase